MRIKLDEDLPRSLSSRLKACGHDVISVLDQELSGASDEVLWNAVQAEGRFLMTADKGFADIRAHPPGNHAGVLLLRPNEDGILALNELLDDLLRGYDLQDLARTVTVATPRRIRIRR